MPFPLAAALLLTAAAPDDGDPPPVPPLSDADRAAISKVEELGGRVVQLAQNDARIDVSFHLGGVTLAPAHFDALAPLSTRLHELNLRGTNLDDALARKLTLFPALRRLHLERTRITDAALVPVGTLEHLESLNLYGTNITDAGLPSLRGLTGLESLYVWDTAVTVSGVLELRKALPEVNYVGVELPPEPRKPLIAPKPTPKDAE